MVVTTRCIASSDEESTLGDELMKRAMIALLLLGSFTALSTMEANALVCARGVYRAGCVGAAGGAVVVRRPYVAARGVYVGRRIYR